MLFYTVQTKKVKKRKKQMNETKFFQKRNETKRNIFKIKTKRNEKKTRAKKGHETKINEKTFFKH
jgi:hypothetical protein